MIHAPFDTLSSPCCDVTVILAHGYMHHPAPGAGDMINIVHIVPRVRAGAGDVPMWYGVYELPMEMPAPEDVVRIQMYDWCSARMCDRAARANC